ncbi:hypothetical protein HDU86_006895 [Geranomyces michiganensis]|nr:hypothetical protein HDU86_006895 [Geranomyces michiganensis]
MSADDAEALLVNIESRNRDEPNAAAQTPVDPTPHDDNPDDELHDAAQVYYASLLAQFQSEQPDAPPPPPDALLAQAKDRLFDDFLIRHARDRRRDVLPTPDRPAKRQAFTDLTLAPTFSNFDQDDSRALVPTATAPAAENKGALELHDLEVAAAAHFGIKPITAGSSNAVVSSFPEIQCALNRRADNIANLSIFKSNLSFSGCPVLAPKCLDDIVWMRFINLEKIHPRSQRLSDKMELHHANSNNIGVRYAGGKDIAMSNISVWLKSWGVYLLVHHYIYPTRCKDLEEYQAKIVTLLGIWPWNTVYHYDQALRKWAQNHLHIPLSQENPKIKAQYLYSRPAVPFHHGGGGGDRPRYLANNGGQQQCGPDPWCRNFQRDRCNRDPGPHPHICSQCRSSAHGLLRCPARTERVPAAQGNQLVPANIQQA